MGLDIDKRIVWRAQRRTQKSAQAFVDVARDSIARTLLTPSHEEPVVHLGCLPVYSFADGKNVGDRLTAPILQALFGVRSWRVSRGFHPKVVGVGSIVHKALQGDVVWGAGALRPRRLDGSGIRYLAVRGPLTRDLIDGDVPSIFGDPGTLLPHFYAPNDSPRRFAVGLIPHFTDSAVMASSDRRVRVLDVRTADWRGFVDAILSCDVIISSSLHGLVLAEAYGRPTVWVQANDRLVGGRFKFDDYFAATDRAVTPRRWAPGAIGALVDDAIEPKTVEHAPLMTAWPSDLRRPVGPSHPRSPMEGSA